MAYLLGINAIQIIQQKCLPAHIITWIFKKFKSDRYFIDKQNFSVKILRKLFVGVDNTYPNQEEDMQKHINRTSLRTILALTLTCSLALLTAACSGGGGEPLPPVAAPSVTRQAFLTTDLEVPAPTLPDPAAATPSGTASFTLDSSTNKLSGSMTLSGFVSPATAPNDVTAAHIHDGTVGNQGGVVIGLVPDDAHVVWSIPTTAPALTADQVEKFKAGGLYVNAHTKTNIPGLVRGQLISFKDNIQKIFTDKCLECHIPGGLGATLSLVSGSSFGNLVGVFSTTSTPAGGIRVIAHDSANSVLFKRLDGNTAGTQMPRVGDRLPDNELNLIKAWIDMGAANN
jgi:hypothetical protein